MKIPETEIAYWNVIYRLHFRDGPTTTSNNKIITSEYPFGIFKLFFLHSRLSWLLKRRFVKEVLCTQFTKNLKRRKLS
jgi:hypothetical protein